MNEDLASRVAALEARVAELEAERVRPQPGVVPPSPPPPRPPAAQVKGLPNWDVLVNNGEGWLGRIGVGLLVVGFVLLYQYAVRQGWLTPTMRVALGLLVGSGLLAGGVFYFPERRRYRQILAAGGIVILFVTGLAASELYHLIDGGTALLFFAAVAATAFTIAARQDESIIASIGSLGALLPPAFLLEDTVPGALLWLYLAVVITWTGVLQAMRGWQKALLFSAGISIIALCHDVPPGLDTKIAAWLAVVACWVCYAALPLVRTRLLAAGEVVPIASGRLLGLPFLVTLGLAFVVAEFILPTYDSAFELSATMDAVGYALIALWLSAYRAVDTPSAPLMWRAEAYRVDGYSAAVVAAVLSISVAAIAGLDMRWWYVALAVIAALAYTGSTLVDVELLRPLAHALFGIILLGFGLSSYSYTSGPAFDDYAVSFMLAGTIAAVVALQLTRNDDRIVYWIAIYFVAHVLMATELSDVNGAPWLASVGYGLVGAALLIRGLGQRQIALQRAGMLSLAMLVARLFMYDLAQVNLGVRIVLFMACGFGFLALSYLVRSRRYTT